MNDNEKITVAAAARLLGLPPSTLSRWVDDGSISPECVFVHQGKPRRLILGKLRRYHPGFFSTKSTISTTCTETAD